MSTPGTRLKPAAHHGWIWGGLIVGLLSMQVVMCLVAVVLATGDEANAIEPNYGEKSLRWDETIAAKRASDALGWESSFDVEPAFGHPVRKVVTLSLLNHAGQPIKDAAVRLTLFHHAHATNTQEAVLAASEPGSYAAEVLMPYSGLWEYRFTVERGTDNFQLTEIRELHDDVAASGLKEPVLP